MTWDDIRRLADMLEVKLHLAGMDARDQWEATKPRLVSAEQSILEAGKKAKLALREIASIAAALHRLREDLADPVKP